MNPIDAYIDAIWMLVTHDCRFNKHTCSKPGQVLKKMPEKIREALKNLKSDDLKKIRPDLLPEIPPGGSFIC